MFSCAQMSRFLDMKDFGEAARYLRLTNLEHLAAKAQAFDGTHAHTRTQCVDQFPQDCVPPLRNEASVDA